MDGHPRGKVAAAVAALAMSVVVSISIGSPASGEETIILDPDVILHGGAIVTMEADLPQAQALAIQGDKLLAVGSDQDILALRGPQTQLIDLGDKAVLPGFIDSHAHWPGGRESNIGFLNLPTAEEAIQAALEKGWTSISFNPALMNDPAIVAPIRVSDNYVEAHGADVEFNGSTGIGVLAGFSQVEGNTIVIDPAAGKGRGILLRGVSGAALHNRILGGGFNAIVFDAPSATFTGAIDTVAVGNDISGFAASDAHVLFREGSRGNTVVGNSGTVRDLGTDNRATGLEPMAGGVGDDVSDAVGPLSD